MYISQFRVKEHKSGRCSVLYNQLYPLWQIKELTIHCFKKCTSDINRQHILVYHYFATQILPVVPFYIHVMITKVNIYIFCILIHIYWFYLILYNRLEERQQSNKLQQINPSVQDYILSIKYQYILGMAIDCRIANRLNDISWWL